MYVHYNTTRALLRATVDKNTIMHILQHIEICANLFAKFQITFLLLQHLWTQVSVNGFCISSLKQTQLIHSFSMTFSYVEMGVGD